MKKITLLFVALIAIALLSTTSVREARLVSNLSVTENLVSPTTTSYWALDGLNETISYRDGSSRADVDNVYADTVLGDGTLDLTSLTNTLGEALDLTGEVVMAIKFSLQDDAAATVTVSNGVSNSYPLMGTTYSFQLKANMSALFQCDTVLIPVASGAKNIDYDSSNDSSALSIILITADGYN